MHSIAMDTGRNKLIIENVTPQIDSDWHDNERPNNSTFKGE